MFIDLDAFKEENKGAIDKLRNSLAKILYINNQLDTHQFPREVIRRYIADKEVETPKIWQLTKTIISLLHSSGASNYEADLAFSTLYREIKKDIETQSHSVNGEKEKWVWIIGGPNGAGKSTFVASDYGSLAGYLPLVNPDEIARTLSPDNVEIVAIEAGRISIERINEYAEKGMGFIVETTLSGHFHHKMAQELKAKGWKIGFVYITNNSPDISIERVRLRVSKGGHDVPEEDIYRRWKRSHSHIGKYIKIADQAFIVDNSTSEGFQLMASGRDGKVVVIRKALLPHVMEHLAAHNLVKTISEVYKEIDNKAVLSAMSVNDSSRIGAEHSHGV